MLLYVISLPVCAGQHPSGQAAAPPAECIAGAYSQSWHAQLAAADEQADHHTETSGSADGFPWIFVDINVGCLGCLPGFGQ